MIPPLFTKYTTLYIIFTASLLLFSSLGLGNLFISGLFFFLLILLVLKDNFIIVLYLIILPTNGLLERSEYLSGVIGIDQVCAIFALIHIIINYNHVGQLIDNGFRKYSINILVVILIYLLYTTIKEHVYGMNYIEFFDVVVRVINIILLYLPLLLILVKLYSPQMIELSESAIMLGFINLAVFAFISSYLPDLGIYSTGIQESLVVDSETSFRYFGVMGDGDANSLGGFFAIGIGYYFAIYRSRDSTLLFSTLLIMGTIVIALTGSRSAFLAFLMMLSVLFLTRSQMGILAKLIFLSLLISISFSFWDLVIARLSSIAPELETNTTSNRIGKWLFYISYFEQNPSVYLLGAKERILAGFNYTFLVSHNLYIQIIYNSGIIILLALFYNYFKIFQTGFRKHNLTKIAIIILPFLIVTLSVSDIGAIYYTLIYLSIINT